MNKRILNFITRPTTATLKLATAAMLFTMLFSVTGNAQICGSIGFYSPVNFAVGGRLQSVDVGDFNLDGKQDLVTANAVTTVVSVLLGNGNGTFKTSVDFQAGNNPGDAAVGDFNGDGKPDIAVANAGGNNISVLINTCAAAPCTAPSFAAPVNFASGNRPRRITTGDVNRDNRLDLMTANENSNSVSVLLGNGDGTFQAKVDFNPIGTQPYDVQVGDFNGDNKLDMVAVNFGMGDTAAVFINTCNASPCAAPSFAAAQTYAVGESPMGVTVADFNGDNKLDLATANYFSSDVSVRLGNGNGTFQNAINYPSASLPNNLTATDLDGDSYLDLVASVDVGSVISVFRGRGDGTFEARADFNVGQSGASDVSKAVVAEDFNGDTLNDLAVAVDMFNSVSIMLNGCGDPPPPAPTSTRTTLFSSHNPSVFGQPITFTATVSIDAPLTTGKSARLALKTRAAAKIDAVKFPASDYLLGGIPTGTVDFFAGGNPISSCTGVALIGGQAQCTIQELPSGNNSISAQYNGDSGNGSSSGSLPGGPQIVTQASSSVSVAASSNPVGTGAPTTLTATVSPVAPSAGTATGTVSFFRNGTSICANAAIDGSGQATCLVTTTVPGTYDVTAQYSGDAGFAGSNNDSSPLALEVVGPTAAAISVAGRVVSRETGRAVGGARVTIIDAAGQTRTVRTSSFGYYLFTGVPAGAVYTFTVSAKGFANVDGIVRRVADDVSGFDIFLDRP